MRWDQGRDEILRLLTERDLQRVNPSRDHADRLIDQAHQHLKSAQSLGASDLEGAYALLYDAARKALAAALENQGLRSTSKGGHLATFHAVRAQLDPPLGQTLLPFDRMRRTRHEVEYPPADALNLTAQDVADDIVKSSLMVELVARILDEMSPF